jgi:hypothetical protein
MLHERSTRPADPWDPWEPVSHEGRKLVLDVHEFLGRSQKLGGKDRSNMDFVQY